MSDPAAQSFFDSIPLLQAVNGWCLVIAAVAGVIAAGAGFLSGLAGNRLNDLQEARREAAIQALKVVDAEHAKAIKDVKFMQWANW